MSTLAGAAAGAATGGVLGALTQAAISDDDAHVYAEGLRRGGGAVVSARVADQDAARLQTGQRIAMMMSSSWLPAQCFCGSLCSAPVD